MRTRRSDEDTTIRRKRRVVRATAHRRPQWADEHIQRLHRYLRSAATHSATVEQCARSWYMQTKSQFRCRLCLHNIAWTADKMRAPMLASWWRWAGPALWRARQGLFHSDGGRGQRYNACAGVCFVVTLGGACATLRVPMLASWWWYWLGSGPWSWFLSPCVCRVHRWNRTNKWPDQDQTWNTVVFSWDSTPIIIQTCLGCYLLVLQDAKPANREQTKVMICLPRWIVDVFHMG